MEGLASQHDHCHQWWIFILLWTASIFGRGRWGQRMCKAPSTHKSCISKPLWAKERISIASLLCFDCTWASCILVHCGTFAMDFVWIGVIFQVCFLIHISANGFYGIETVCLLRILLEFKRLFLHIKNRYCSIIPKDCK